MGRPKGSRNKSLEDIPGWDERIRSTERKVPKRTTARGNEAIRAQPSTHDELMSRLGEIRQRIARRYTCHQTFTWQLTRWGYSWDHFTKMYNDAKQLPWEVFDADAKKDFEKDLEWLETYRTQLLEKEQYEYADRVTEQILKIKGRYIGKGGNVQLNVSATGDINNLTDTQVKAKIEQLTTELNGHGNSNSSVGPAEGTEPAAPFA